MKTNHVKAKLKRGEASIGTWLSIPDPTTATLMAQVGFDWLNLNIEHMPIGVRDSVLVLFCHRIHPHRSFGPSCLEYRREH